MFVPMFRQTAAELEGFHWYQSSNISLIERGQSSPTAVALDRLSSALGVTVAARFEEPAEEADPSPLSQAGSQQDWTDPASGYRRRNLSPLGQPLQLVEVSFPLGQTVAYETGARQLAVHQQVWLLEGRVARYLVALCDPR